MSLKKLKSRLKYETLLHSFSWHHDMRLTATEPMEMLPCVHLLEPRCFSDSEKKMTETPFCLLPMLKENHIKETEPPKCTPKMSPVGSFCKIVWQMDKIDGGDLQPVSYKRFWAREAPPPFPTTSQSAQRLVTPTVFYRLSPCSSGWRRFCFERCLLSPSPNSWLFLSHSLNNTSES